MPLKLSDEKVLTGIILGPSILRFDSLTTNEIIRRIWLTEDIEIKVPSLRDNSDIINLLQRLRTRIEFTNGRWQIKTKEKA